ncbi:hypothetical protein F503_07431 [Ophiostoma piceae UAMH 11346]|uniref:Uncharacterized protein n=1 Tax=Ophiostoma piceae (strain UAMH 11346) TaxID=1262450 RepID=S3D891_OPHP1|nr:hypothetical protein F503_07431 [Ophiostoma piceae UAMH 11346]
MDDHFRRRKQNEHAMRPPSDPRYHQPGQDASQRHYHQSGSSSNDRQRIPPGGGRVISGSGASAGYGGYYQDTAEGTFPTGTGLPHGAMGYSQQTADYTQDARQNFAGAYNPLYGVQQAGSQNTVFDTTQSFGSRQHSGIPMMTADVASAAPYFASDSTGAAAAAAALHAQGGQSSSVYQHQASSDSRSSVVGGGYGGNMGATLSSTGGSGLASHPPQASASNPEPSSSTGAATASGSRDYAETNESFVSYQRNLKDVFKNIKNGALVPASETLLSISDWLLTRAESLGLTQDDEDLYEGRVKLWNNFNNAWLGLLEKQREFMWSGRTLHRSQSLVSFEDLQKMARELVRLCDSVERFGLVDYDYGVWEERIMAILTECVELYNMAEDEAAGVTSGPGEHQG